MLCPIDVNGHWQITFANSWESEGGATKKIQFWKQAHTKCQQFFPYVAHLKSLKIKFLQTKYKIQNSNGFFHIWLCWNRGHTKAFLNHLKSLEYIISFMLHPSTSCERCGQKTFTHLLIFKNYWDQSRSPSHPWMPRFFYANLQPWRDLTPPFLYSQLLLTGWRTVAKCKGHDEKKNNKVYITFESLKHTKQLVMADVFAKILSNATTT